MVGAVLTQATQWRNVERAIRELKRDRALTPRQLVRMRRDRLERAVHATGYFRQKATRLKQLTQWYIDRYGGSPRRMFQTPWRALRQELLALNGIGPETADSILLYAGGHPVFVVDAYTLRILKRHRVIHPRATYDQAQQQVMTTWPARTQVYNELHALLVAVGKQYCHRQHPECTRCPLGMLPHTAS